MSASYLVDEAGEPRLIGIGDQNVTIKDNKFMYTGGSIPGVRTVDEGPLRAAVRAVPGLRGFVGVDFVADRNTGAATVVEINPRPTSSCVGLGALLPPGRLARAWLTACGGASTDRPGFFAELAETLAGRQAVSFAADGTILID